MLVHHGACGVYGVSVFERVRADRAVEHTVSSCSTRISAGSTTTTKTGSTATTEVHSDR